MWMLLDAPKLLLFINGGMQVNMLNVSSLVDFCLLQKDHHPFISQVHIINGPKWGGEKSNILSTDLQKKII